MLSEICQIERQVLFGMTYLWNLKEQNKCIEQSKNRLTDAENKTSVTTMGRVKGEGQDGGKEMKRFELLHIKYFIHLLIEAPPMARGSSQARGRV